MKKLTVIEKTFDFNGDFNGYLATSNYYKNGILYDNKGNRIETFI